MRLITLCSCLKTKESYDRWIIRRVWGFRHQISKAKNLKNVGHKYREALRRFLQPCKMAAKFYSMKDTISQPKADFAALLLWFRSLQNWPSTWCDRLPMALTSSFQLRIVYRLKRWIADFTSFETKYNIHKLSSRKCSKSVQQLLSSWILHVRFLSFFSSLHSWFAYGKGL